MNQYPLAFIPLIFLSWCAVSFLIAAVSGWMDLAQRLRLSSPFAGSTWSFQSASMRWMSRYRSCLNVGADPSGLQLSMFFLFRPGHPPLFIPWSEVTVARRWTFLFVPQVKLLLGREEQIPFVISETLADRIQAAAGASWPIEQVS
ncbi:MAG TPA: hypothetical protein VNR65_12515 [Geobacterales bacterium]|nr:hypothetical protein [Geobacterales bacterium]